MFKLFISGLFWLSTGAFAANVLDLDSNARGLTTAFANAEAILGVGGHAVTAGSLTSLPDNDLLAVIEPAVGFSATEITAVQNFVSSGGILLAITDSGCDGCAEINALLAGIGSGLTINTGSGAGAPLASTPFTTSPRDIAGLSLNLSPGSQVTSGSALAGTIAGFEQIGSGLVVAFGDVFVFDALIGTDDSSPNARLLLNLADNAAPTVADPPDATPPEAVPALSPPLLGLLACLVLTVGVLAAGRRTS